ncbi:DUF2971 domain-containing protein [Colwellia sp. Arc7-635]|uniref:DUF2971 domain-containing protein n=1 Tax=Colwellia sp. Arc7-635 TaxID=2497879 RepID=UPI0019D2F4FE|nr:DUF2971 domain-containing protein [Colwellia sp. Arc7-635]
MSASSFYKYCPVYQDKSFENEYSVLNLLADQVTFSTRKNFNDLFDSKVNLIKPSRKELKELSRKLKTSKRIEFKDTFYGDDWESKIQLFEQKVEEIFDNYLYYCVTDRNNSNLMWSHYANSHKGFCIEWDAAKIQAEKVKYQSKIPKFKLIDIIETHAGIGDNTKVGITIWQALRTKLDEWEYESEYRFQMSNSMEQFVVKKEPNYTLVKYQPEWIKSIIWGCRTTEKTKKHIKENLHFDVKFKQATEGLSSIAITELT